MDIVFNSLTSIPEPPKEPDSIGGALWVEADEAENLPERYELVDINKVDQLLETEREVLGRDEAEIERQLETYHPAPKGLTNILRCDHVFRVTDSWKKTYYRSRRIMGEYKFDGWIVLPKPLATTDNLDELLGLIKEHGPLLVEYDQYVLWGKTEGLRDAGFTCVGRRFDLYQVNFNPRRTSLKPYRDKVSTYEDRITGRFPANAIEDLFEAMRPDVRNNGCSCPSLLLTNADEKPSLDDIRDLFELNQIISKSKWWRETDPGGAHIYRKAIHKCDERHGNRYKFSEAIAACLPYLHAFEAQALKQKAGEDEYHKDEPLPAKLRTTGRTHLWFCQFLRNEARAFKLKIPRPPMEPVRPKPKKARKKRVSRKNDPHRRSRSRGSGGRTNHGSEGQAG